MNAAPNDAADESPRVNGLTRGFLRSACMTAPARARQTPASAARKIRGSLRLKRIIAVFSLTALSEIPGMTELSSTEIMSEGGMYTLPLAAAKIIASIRRMTVTAITAIF